MDISTYRKKLNLTQDAAAEQLGVSKDVYCSWEYGVRLPRPESMKKITDWSHGEVMPNDFYGVTTAEAN